MMQNEIHLTLQILFAQTNSLNLLIDMSTFTGDEILYKADLRGIDLSNQDLRNLLFSGTDLRSAKLDGIMFDEGAFNSAILDEEYDYIKDEYDFSLNDYLGFMKLEPFYKYRVRVRPGFLDTFHMLQSITYNDFAVASGLSINPLRRARLGETISSKTIEAITRTLVRMVNGEFAHLAFKQVSDEERLIDGRRLSIPALVAVELWGESTATKEQITVSEQSIRASLHNLKQS